MKLMNTFLLVTALLLTGCATSNLKATISPQDLQAKNTAVLVLTLSQPINSLHYGAATIYFDAKGKKSVGRSWVETFGLDYGFGKPDTDVAGEYTLLKVIEVPAGQLDLTGWGFNAQGVRIESTKASPTLTLNLKAGEVVYVGNFELQPEYGENLFGMTMVNGALAFINDQSQRDLALLKSRYPQLGQAVHQQQPVGLWAIDEFKRLYAISAAEAGKKLSQVNSQPDAKKPAATTPAAEPKKDQP